jgi:hypothetical protein
MNIYTTTMNKKILITCLLGFITLFAGTSNAQVSLNVNIGAQPLWGPVGYEQANYYYLPDIDTYYNVPTRQYVYLQNGGWVFSNSLPYRHRSYNLYNGYKVVMNSPRPYRYYSSHKVKYARYRGYTGKQHSIRYSNNPRYYVVKGHPKHSYRPSRSYSKNNYNSRPRVSYASGRNYSLGKSYSHGTGNSQRGNSHGKGNGNDQGGGKGGHGKGKH